MNEYKILYNNLIKQIKETKTKHQLLKTQKETIEKELNELEKKLKQKQKELTKLEIDKNKTLTNKNLKIKLITSLIITSILIMILLSIILLGISYQTYSIFNKIILSIISIISITAIDIAIIISTVNMLIQRKNKQIKKSLEYQNIINEIEIIKQDIKKITEQLNDKKENHKQINIQYLHIDTDLNMKKTLIKYIEKDILNYQEKENIESKEHTKKKTLDRIL